MLKKPKGNINSYLALGFFGHAHTTGICEFLHSVLGYEYVYKVDYREDVRRCIPIEIPIHLADDLKAYKRDGIELYHRQLDVERRHRAFMLSGKMEQYDPRSFGEIVNNYLVDVTGDKSMRECVLTLLEEVIVKWNTNRYAPQYTHEIVLACILSLLDVDILQKYKYLNKGVIERMINYIKKRPMRFKKYGKNRCILRFDEDEKELLSPIEELLLRADKKFIKVFHLDDLDHLYEIDNVHIANNVRLKVRTILRLFGAKEIDLYNWAMEVVKIVSGFCNGLYNARYKNALIMSIAIILVKIRSSWSEVYIIDHLTGREKVDPKVVIPMIQLIESKLENFIGNKFL
jgi:hypothetical protein